MQQPLRLLLSGLVLPSLPALEAVLESAPLDVAAFAAALAISSLTDSRRRYSFCIAMKTITDTATIGTLTKPPPIILPYRSFREHHNSRGIQWLTNANARCHIGRDGQPPVWPVRGRDDVHHPRMKRAEEEIDDAQA